MRLFAPDRPFAVDSWPLYYGWVILLVSSLGVVASIPGQTIGVGAFNESLLAALPVDRVWLSRSYAVGTLASGLLMPWAGRLYDRHGARRMVVVATLGLGTTLLCFSQVDRIVALWPQLLPTVAVLCVLFFFLRFMGQGLLTMVSRNMLSKWFRARRGLTSGIAGVVVAFGFGSGPLLFKMLVDAWTWRGAWLLLAAGCGAGMALIGWLFYRDNPEECGLRMDGAPAPIAGAAQQEAEDEPGFTWPQARRTLAFWAVALSLSAQGLVVTGFSFHIEALGASAGISAEAAYGLFLPMALIATATGFAVGWACDRVPMRRLLIFMMAAQALALVASMQLGQPLWYWLAALGWGLSGGCFGPLSAVALPNYFGRPHLGAISGMMMSMLVVASSLGPIWLAQVQDASGDFGSGLTSYLILPLLCMGLALETRPPRLETNDA